MISFLEFRVTDTTWIEMFWAGPVVFCRLNCTWYEIMLLCFLRACQCLIHVFQTEHVHRDIRKITNTVCCGLYVTLPGSSHIICLSIQHNYESHIYWCIVRYYLFDVHQVQGNVWSESWHISVSKNVLFLKGIVNFMLKRRLLIWFLLNECEDLYEKMQLNL